MNPWQPQLLIPRWIGFFGWALSAVTTSCSSAPMGGQTGGEVDTPACEEQSEVVGQNDATPLGFTAAASAMTFANRVVLTVSPTWMPPTDPARITYVPPSSDATLGFSLTLADDEANYIRSQVNTSGDGAQSALGMVDEPCRNRLELPVRVTLTTPEGELNEVFDATLRVYSMDEARLDATLDPQNLSGTLQISTPDSTIEGLDLRLRLRFGPGAVPLDGGVELGWSAMEGETASYTTSTVATW